MLKMQYRKEYQWTIALREMKKKRNMKECETSTTVEQETGRCWVLAIKDLAKHIVKTMRLLLQ